MITIPRLQEFLCGISIKNGSYIVLATNLILTFFGLVYITASRVEEDQDTNETANLDIEYILYMVVSILVFVSIPLALYGTYRDRASFIIPYLGVKSAGVLLLAVHIVLEIILSFGKEHTFRISLIIMMLGLFLLVAYSFLVVFSYYTTLKQQREEIQ